MSVARKPWVVAIVRHGPGAGATGRHVTETAHVFDSEEEFNLWLNVDAHRHLTNVIYGDPRGFSGEVNEWDKAADAVWLHGGE